MSMLNLTASEWWLIIGFICIIVEFTHFPNIGFLFLGLGAITEFVILCLFPNLLKYQYIIFGVSSFLWFCILWWPLKHYVHNRHSENNTYSDMVGKEVEVYSDRLSSKEIGQILWSGVVMNAKLSEGEESIFKGSTTRVKRVVGNVFICSSLIKD